MEDHDSAQNYSDDETGAGFLQGGYQEQGVPGGVVVHLLKSTESIWNPKHSRALILLKGLAVVPRRNRI